jgi:hypothetical protein
VPLVRRSENAAHWCFLSFAMTVLKKRIFYGLGCAVLIAAGIYALLPADPAVNGLSRKDVVQIRDMVRSEISRSATKRLSLSRISHSPRQVWRSVRNRVTPPDQWQDLAGVTSMKSGEFSTLPKNTWLITTTEGDVFIVEKERVTGESTVAVKYGKKTTHGNWSRANQHLLPSPRWVLYFMLGAIGAVSQRCSIKQTWTHNRFHSLKGFAYGQGPGPQRRWRC